LLYMDNLMLYSHKAEKVGQSSLSSWNTGTDPIMRAPHW
jgi:hypothetical protein